jgi:flagellar assembly factor FliW
MIIETGRFGQLKLTEEEMIQIPQGIMGFPELTRFCLVDPADDTLILWLQSLDNPNVVFPVLEPKVFRTDYAVRLSAAELRELKLENVNQAAVLSILTIPSDVTQMTANLKAPLVINLKHQVARQVVLQENEYSVKHLMFKELKAHLVTMAAQSRSAAERDDEASRMSMPVSVRSLPASAAVRALNA